MIIIINGPSGVGKTQTSWELLYRMPHTVVLDMDYIGWAFHSFDYSNQSHIDYAHSTLFVLIKHHLQNGFYHFIVNGGFESSEKLNQILNVLYPLNLPIQVFCLWCNFKQLIYRVETRNSYNINCDESISHQEVFDIMEYSAKSGYIGRIVDNTQLSIRETSDQILDYVRQENQIFT